MSKQARDREREREREARKKIESERPPVALRQPAEKQEEKYPLERTYVY